MRRNSGLMEWWQGYPRRLEEDYSENDILKLSATFFRSGILSQNKEEKSYHGHRHKKRSKSKSCERSDRSTSKSYEPKHRSISKSVGHGSSPLQSEKKRYRSRNCSIKTDDDSISLSVQYKRLAPRKHSSKSAESVSPSVQIESKRHRKERKRKDDAISNDKSESRDYIDVHEKLRSGGHQRNHLESEYGHSSGKPKHRKR